MLDFLLGLISSAQVCSLSSGSQPLRRVPFKQACTTYDPWVRFVQQKAFYLACKVQNFAYLDCFVHIFLF
jgi:hypothetical protein